MDNYTEIKHALSPKREIKAPATLRARINKSTQAYRRRHRLIWICSIATSIAAILCIALLMPMHLSATEIMKRAKTYFTETPDLELNLQIRTIPNENFEYISPTAPFVTHQITLSRTSTQYKWRVDKIGRIALCSNDTIYSWLPKAKIGWTYSNPSTDFLGFIGLFIKPATLMTEEMKFVESHPEALSEITETKDEIHFTINAPAEGNYASPYTNYVLNTSIPTSESIRKYVFDSKTLRLKAATVSIIVENREVEVIKVKDIRYNNTNHTDYSIPEGIAFTSIDSAPEGVNATSATEAARIFFHACSNRDSNIINRMGYGDLIDFILDTYGGCTLEQTGIEFKSGPNELLTFVPYTVTLNNGITTSHNICIRLNTERQTWYVDGGI